MIFLFPRWEMLVPRKVFILTSMVYMKNGGWVGCEKFLTMVSMFIGLIALTLVISGDWWKSKLIIQPPGTHGMVLSLWPGVWCHRMAFWVSTVVTPWVPHVKVEAWEWSWIGSGVGTLKECIADIFDDMLAVGCAIRWVPLLKYYIRSLSFWHHL